MAADGSVVIQARLDDKQAQAELNRLTKKIDTLQAKISQSKSEQFPWVEKAGELVAKLDAAKADLDMMQTAAKGTFSSDEIAEQKETVRALQAQWNEAQGQVERYDKAIEKAESQVALAETQAGQLTNQLIQTGNAASEGAEKINQLGNESVRTGSKGANAFKKFEKRVVGLAKRVFIFSMITKALRSFREQIGNIIKGNDEASQAINNLKVSLASLVAPIMQAVLPAFTAFVNMLAYVIQSIASLFGGTVESGEALLKEEAALKKTGAAAGKASKQLAAFDEINRLAEDSAGSGAETPTSNLANISLPDTFKAAVDSFMLSFKDILFDWSDLTPEQIVEKAIGALGAFIGAGLGFMIGGVPGAITGALIGIALSAVFSSLIFDHDGTISRAELTKLIMAGVGGLIGAAIGISLGGGVEGALIGFTIGASVSLLFSDLLIDKNGQINGDTAKSVIMGGISGILGGILGFTLAPPGFRAAGALIGFTIGAGISLVISAIQREKAEDRFLSTTIGQELQALADEAASMKTASVDLLVHINSITGEVDDSTMANFSLAKQLIDDIFTMDSADNKTAAEIAIIEEKIQTLNGLNLDGLNLSFDESTGHVSQTRDEVDNLMDSILKQYKIEALREAYIESYKSQYDAVTNLEKSTDEYKQALEKLSKAESDYKALANMTTDELEQNWDSLVEKFGTDNLWNMFEQARMRVEKAKDAVTDTKTALENSQTAIDETTHKMAELKVTLEGLVTDGAENGTAVIASVEEEIRKNTPRLETAMKEATAALNDTFRTQNKITGAESGLYREEAKFISDGIAAGIMDGKDITVGAIRNIAGAMQDAYETATDTHSPSGVYETEGNMLMEGLANGITNNAFKPLEAIKAVMNDLITLAERGMNNIVTKFNGIGSAVSALGGGTVPTLDRAYIPRLAQGAVIPPNREFLAVLGDQKRGTNIETPLSTMVEAFRQAMGSTGGSRQPIVLEVGGREFGRIIVDLYNQESQRVGVKIGGKA